MLLCIGLRPARVAKFILALGAAAVLGVLPAYSVEEWMPADELAQTFRGVAIDGVYEDGRKFSEHYLDDGSLSYEEGPRQTSGYWSITAGTFCTIYRGDSSGGCYRVARIGANCFEFYFVARTEAQVRRREDGKPGWTARGWKKTQPATCVETPTV